MAYSIFANPTTSVTSAATITTSPGTITMASGAVGSTSDYITVTGSNGLSWNDMSSITQSSISPNTLQVRGDADFQGDLRIQGVSLKDTLDNINERLAILKPNPELESRWDELRELRRKYTELEAEILEKEEIVRILKR